MSCQACESSAGDRGIFGPFLGRRRYVSERFGVSGERGARGKVGSGSLRAAAPFTLLPVIAARPAGASFSSCVAGLQEAAAKAGVSRSVTSRALDIARPDEKALRLSEVQPEFKTPIWDYLGFLVDEQCVADGRAMMRQYDHMLRAAERRFGVNRHVIAAVWGVETDYGREAGGRLAVDFDGDGRRDLVRSVADALGSTANYLKRSGWQPGDPWMIEVTVPRGYDGPTGRGNKSSLSSWAQHNVLRADGAQLSAGAPVVYKEAGLLLPAGPQGPGFLVFRNFDAISYNQAESYALAISYLADRLAGHPPLRTPWPTDDPGLTRAERRHLQQLLLANGYHIGRGGREDRPGHPRGHPMRKGASGEAITPAALC